MVGAILLVVYWPYLAQANCIVDMCVARMDIKQSWCSFYQRHVRLHGGTHVNCAFLLQCILISCHVLEMTRTECCSGIMRAFSFRPLAGFFIHFARRTHYVPLLFKPCAYTLSSLLVRWCMLILCYVTGTWELSFVRLQ
jgi:hypothetical protein